VHFKLLLWYIHRVTSSHPVNIPEQQFEMHLLLEPNNTRIFLVNIYSLLRPCFL